MQTALVLSMAVPIFALLVLSVADPLCALWRCVIRLWKRRR